MLVNFVSKHSSADYTPSPYTSIPVQGFEVLQRGGGLYFDESVKAGYVVAYNFDPPKNRFPLLSCLPADEFRAQRSQTVVTV